MRTKLFLLFAILFLNASAKASEDKITCSIPRMERDVIIEKAKLVWVDPDQPESKREIASVDSFSVRTKTFHRGMEKIMMKNGEKYTIHIEDVSNMNEVDDYILIRSKEGHEMTYPILCQK